jgi:hypothetical protein
MPTWSQFEAAAPDLAAVVRARLDAHAHKTLATLRRDGSPRISGTEAVFEGGQLWIGSMPGALKARDLQRDGRFALHSGSVDPPDWDGDAKVAGYAIEVDAPGGGHRFDLDLREVSTVGLNARRDGLVITVWTPERGVRELSR